MAVRPDISAIGKSSTGVLMIEALRKGKENFKTCQWPGTDSPDAQFCMVPLLCDELQTAYAATWARWRTMDLEMNVYNSDDFYAELAIQVLCRSMKELDGDQPGKNLFEDADQLRSAIRASERDSLSEMYSDYVAEVDPNPDEMSPAKFEEIQEYVKKKDVIQLSALSSRTLAVYIIGMESPSAS